MAHASTSSAPEGLLVFAGKLVGYECLKYLVAAGYPIAHVVVAHETDDLIIALAAEARLSHHVFGSRENTAARLQGRRFTWLLNLWSSHILPPALLGLATHRLNIHPSYAPHGLGSDSATWAIRERTTAGVSLLEMEAGVDRGGVFAQQAVARTFPETAQTLFERLKHAGIALFRDKWPDIHAGRIVAIAQAGGGSYHTTKMTRADRCLDGSQQLTAAGFIDWALAHDFAPRSAAEIVLGSVRYRVTVQLTPCPSVPPPSSSAPVPCALPSLCL